MTSSNNNNVDVDAIIIGSGLAGLTVALTILDAGGHVIILEKEAKPGGNSMKASSGINAGPVDDEDNNNVDSLQQFKMDTMTSAGPSRTDLQQELVSTLVKESRTALEWLKSRANVDVSNVAQLGGHSYPRTYRPSGKLPIGAELMIHLQNELKAFLPKGNDEEKEQQLSAAAAQLITNAKVIKLVTQNDINTTNRVTGVVYQDVTTQKEITLMASHVVLATGGFAAGKTMMKKYRPDLVEYPTTAGLWSTGDGIVLALEEETIQANVVDMQHIQVHPTGFIDPKDPNNSNKFLAAEVLRGVGGILLNTKGQRYAKCVVESTRDRKKQNLPICVITSHVFLPFTDFVMN